LQKREGLERECGARRKVGVSDHTLGPGDAPPEKKLEVRAKERVGMGRKHKAGGGLLTTERG